MIVTDPSHPAVHLGQGGERIRVRCLARRGMLHSECDAFDHVRLAAGARYELVGRSGTEAAWYVLRGRVGLLDHTGRPQRVLHDGELLLAVDGGAVRLCGGPQGAELLCLTLTPAAVSRRLPPRRPDLTAHR